MKNLFIRFFSALFPSLRTMHSSNEQLHQTAQKHPLPPESITVRIMQHPFLKEVCKTLDEHLDEADFSIPDLARQLSMSARTLNRKVNGIIQMTPNELVRVYRLEKAASFLSEGASISSAAYMSGFESPSYFGQRFKEHYHLTPSEFIRHQQQ